MNQNWQRSIPIRLRLGLWLLLGLVAGILLWASLYTVSAEVVVAGRLEAKPHSISLTAPTAGRVVSRLLEPPGRVQAGAVVLVLDTLGVDERDTWLKLRSQQLRLGQAQRAERSQASVEHQLLLRQAQAVMAEMAHLARYRVSSPATGRLIRAAPEGERVRAGQVVAEIETQAPAPRFRGESAVEAELELGQQVEIVWEGFSDTRYGTTPGTVVERSATSPSRLRFAIELGSLRLGQQSLTDGQRGEVRLRTRPKRVISLFWEWLNGA